MATNMLRTMWNMILVIVSFVIPVFGLIPAIYLWLQRKLDPEIGSMRGWILAALICQLAYIAVPILVFLIFSPA